MGNKLITQVILVVTSVAIILTYIRPAFEDIADIQDDIAKFENTVSRATDLNSALQDLVATERSISQRESQNLDTYLPRDINDVLVMRDIQNIFKIVNVPITTLNSLSGDTFQAQISAAVEGNQASARVLDEGAPTAIFKDFQLTFFGTYEHLKLIMQGLEVNAYPLEVVELAFAAAPDPEDAESDFGLPPGVMKFDMTLRAFALPGAQ